MDVFKNAGSEISKLKDLMITAKQCFEKADYRKAMLLLDEVIQGDENATEAYFLLANIFHIKGEVSKAIKGFKRVLELDPLHTDAAISLSVLLNDIGKYDEAQKIFEKAQSQVKQVSSGVSDPHINKKFSLKHLELAELYFTYNRYDEALFEYNKAMGLDPSNLELRIKVAKVYAKKGYITKAFEELKRLRNEYPGHIPSRLALGLLFYGQGQILEAQTEWQNILAKDPSHSEAKMYLTLSKSATETSV